MNHHELKTLVRILDHLGKPWCELPYGLRDLIELDLPNLARAWDQLSIEQHREALRSHVAGQLQDLHLKIGFDKDDAEASASLRRELALAHDIIEKLNAPGTDQGETYDIALARATASITSWAEELHGNGLTITEKMMKNRFPNITVRDRRKLLKAKVPEDWRARRGTAPSRRRRGI